MYLYLNSAILQIVKQPFMRQLGQGERLTNPINRIIIFERTDRFTLGRMTFDLTVNTRTTQAG